jgi:hypothetical protein
VKRTPLQQERLDAAVAALSAAGAEKLHERLLVAFEQYELTDKWSELHSVMMQGRAWASIDIDREYRPRREVARDAIGLLWAVLEDEAVS